MSSRRAWCQSRLNSSCSRAVIVGEVEHLFEEVDPEDGLHRPVGTAVVRAVHGSKALLVNQGERLVSENLGPTSLQALSLLRRHQEPGLPEALLRVSYSEHPPLPRPGAAPTTFYYIIPTLPQAGEGFLRTNQHLDTEEATKSALVLPFIQMLGYEIFDPTEVVPEFTADVGLKKGEKVDYALIQDGKPVVLIECKRFGSNLDDADVSQLLRYFYPTRTPALAS